MKHGDYPTAMRLLRPIAEQGYASAQFNLGVMYEMGLGVPQDFTLVFVAITLIVLALAEYYTQHSGRMRKPVTP